VAVVAVRVAVVTVRAAAAGWSVVVAAQAAAGWVAAAGWSVVVAAQAAAGWPVVAGWVRQVAACLAVRAVAADSCVARVVVADSCVARVVVADSCVALAAEGISAHLVAVVERRASLARLAVAAVAVALLVLSMDYGLALVLVRAVVLVSVPRMARRLARASAVRRCISRAVDCGSSITATSTFLCRLLAPGFGVTILAGGTPIGGGSTATTDTRP
jgi:hypothetical protein